VRLGSCTLLGLRDSAYARNVLHAVTTDGGVGFCHAAVPALLPIGYHGPLVVALDSNLLIDLQQYGHELLNDEISVTEEKYAEELESLGTLLNLWMLRDIRFVVTPRARSDARRWAPGFSALIDGLAESLAFQFGDWTVTAPSSGPRLVPVGEEWGLPDSADRDLVLEAQAAGVHIFLTRDRRLLRRTNLTGPAMRVLAPSEVADELAIAGVSPFAGGTCSEPNCPYRDPDIPAPDIGKWDGLFSHFGEG
jgi:hypothetical protein